MATTWKELRNELNISNESENIIHLEKEIIRTMVKIREENCNDRDNTIVML